MLLLNVQLLAVPPATIAYVTVPVPVPPVVDNVGVAEYAVPLEFADVNEAEIFSVA